jgi:RecG-like helicase
VIFKIYLQIGHNNFLEIEDFEDNPLIIKPFEIYYKEYEPIDLYSIGMGRILLNDLVDKKTIKRRIVLSTSEGKYVVKDFINYWDPIGLFFQNYATAIIRPLRSTYKGKSYGSNAKYIVEFKMENGSEEIVPIYPRDYEVRKFKHFSLTRESLESKEILEEFLYEKVLKGTIKCTDVSVYGMDNWRKEIYEDETKRVITAKYLNWFEYFIVARIESRISDYRLKKQNRAPKSKKGLTKRAAGGRDSARFQASSTPKENPASKQNSRSPRRW